MNNKNRAKALRKEYFENYVEFEYIVRKIACVFIYDYKTRHKSLKEVLRDLSKNNTTKDGKLPIKKMKQHLIIRNGLAHSPGNKTGKCGQIILMKEIVTFNDKLIKIKKQKMAKNYK